MPWGYPPYGTTDVASSKLRCGSEPAGQRADCWPRFRGAGRPVDAIPGASFRVETRAVASSRSYPRKPSGGSPGASWMRGRLELQKGDHNGLPSTSMGPWRGAYRPAARRSQPGNGQRSGRGTCCRNWSRRVADRPRTVAGERSGLSERQPPAAAATFLAAAPASYRPGAPPPFVCSRAGDRAFRVHARSAHAPKTGGARTTPRSTRALRPGKSYPAERHLGMNYADRAPHRRYWFVCASPGHA